MTKWVPSSSTTTPPNSSQSAASSGRTGPLFAPLGFDGGRRERGRLDHAGERGPPGGGIEQVVGRATLVVDPAAPADPAGRHRGVGDDFEDMTGPPGQGSATATRRGGAGEAQVAAAVDRETVPEGSSDQVSGEPLGEAAAVEAHAGGRSDLPAVEVELAPARVRIWRAAGRRTGASHQRELERQRRRPGRRRSRRPRSRPSSVPSTRPPVGLRRLARRSRAGASWWCSRAPTSRGSAFRRESSVPGRKRLKRTCQFSHAAAGVLLGRRVAAQTPQREPKQSNLMTAVGVGVWRRTSGAPAGITTRATASRNQAAPASVPIIQRVDDAQHPGQRGEAMQVAPALEPMRPGSSRTGRGSERPAARRSRAQPQPLVARDEGDRHVGQAQVDVGVAEQREGVHGERDHRGQRERLVPDAQVAEPRRRVLIIRPSATARLDASSAVIPAARLVIQKTCSVMTGSCSSSRRCRRTRTCPRDASVEVVVSDAGRRGRARVEATVVVSGPWSRRTRRRPMRGRRRRGSKR